MRPGLTLLIGVQVSRSPARTRCQYGVRGTLTPFSIALSATSLDGRALLTASASYTSVRAAPCPEPIIICCWDSFDVRQTTASKARSTSVAFFGTASETPESGATLPPSMTG